MSKGGVWGVVLESKLSWLKSPFPHQFPHLLPISQTSGGGPPACPPEPKGGFPPLSASCRGPPAPAAATPSCSDSCIDTLARWGFSLSSPCWDGDPVTKVPGMLKALALGSEGPLAAVGHELSVSHCLECPRSACTQRVFGNASCYVGALAGRGGTERSRFCVLRALSPHPPLPGCSARKPPTSQKHTDLCSCSTL